MEMQQHWERVDRTKAPDQVSWSRPYLETSLALIERSTRGHRSASIIDVGGGASTLVDDLIEREYRNITVLDISQAALDAAHKRLGKTLPGSVRWLRADVTQAGFPPHLYDVWFYTVTAPWKQ